MAHSKTKWLFRLIADIDRFKWLHADREDPRVRRILKLLSQPAQVGRRWKPFPVELQGRTSKGRIVAPIPDLAEVLSCPLFSPRAWEALRPLIANSVEPLKLPSPMGDYLLGHVAHVNCLDRRKSTIDCLENGAVLGVDEYAIKWPAISKHHIFCLPETFDLEIIVSPEFKACVEESKLQGVIFEPLPLAE